NDKFDLIVFGLLDSHTTTTLTNARLDHFVYTLEGIKAARALLKPDGLMTVMFVFKKEFIFDRIATTLREAFGARPVVIGFNSSRVGGNGAMFINGDLTLVKSQIAG